MTRRARDRAALRALARHVWGDRYYEHHVRRRVRRRQRVAACAVIGIGCQLLFSALVLLVSSSAASAHVTTIQISCAQVSFSYQQFPNVTASAHESVVIDGAEVAQRDFSFVGPSATDVIAISVGSGMHTVDASTAWTFNNAPQGNAHASRELSQCSANTTTTTESSTTTSSTTTSSTTTTTTSAPTTTTSTTTPTPTTTTTTTTTTTSTTTTTTTTTTSTTTTTTVPRTSTTAAPATSTSMPTSSTVHQQGSTSPTTTPTSPNGGLPRTGSGELALATALALLGLGILAIGVAALRRDLGRS